MKDTGHSILGDSKYGNKSDRLYLHAYELQIINPINKKLIDFKIELPIECEKVLKK